jgi:hypothetical protein
MRWHNLLVHVSMHRLQPMATQGHLPIRIAKCRVHLCQACVFGKLTRRPWRGKMRLQEGEIDEVTFAGQCVSVNQLESPVAAFVGQMKGILTKKRHKVATVFVNHFSKFSFVHLQSSTKAEDTIKLRLNLNTWLCRSK